MGCQCSQAASVTPQQPHSLDSELTPNYQIPQSNEPKVAEIHPQKTPLSAQPIQLLTCDKENQPCQSTQKGSRLQGDKWPTSETNLKAKPEKRKSEVPILDSTNLSKLNQVVKQKASREEKPLTSRSEYKVEDEPSVGPSSKSIQLAEQIKEECKDTKKEKSEAKKDFVLEQWQKGEGEQLSRTERLKIVDQVQIQKEEVNRYLNEVWDYEKEVVNGIIGYLELHQLKKYEQPLVVTQ